MDSSVSDSSQYVRIRRTTSGQTNPTLMNVVGGNMYLGEYGDEIDDLRIYNYGKSQFKGETILGGRLSKMVQTQVINQEGLDLKEM